MTTLHLSLDLQSPILLAGVGNGEENSCRTMPYIPGAALRGALLEAALRSGAPDAVRQVFFSEHTRFLNAYPASKGIRSLPTPGSWRKKKGENLPLTRDAFTDLAREWKDEMESRIEEPFHFIDGDEHSDLADEARLAPVLIQPDTNVRIHIGGEGRRKVGKGLSTVFSYVSLAPGQTYSAEIRVHEGGGSLQDLKGHLDGIQEILIGRSRSAGYGRVKLTTSISEDKPEIEEEDPGDRTILLFVSDAILRNPEGQYTADVDAYLARLLGKEKLSSIAACLTGRLIGGFNRTWGLPTPQVPAIGMGSVIVYKSSDFRPETARGILRDGIGERRIDGYGRLVVNARSHQAQRLVKGSRSDNAPPIALSESSKVQAREMAQRLLDRRLETVILKTVQEYTFQGTASNHALSRLRAALHRQMYSSTPDIRTVLTGVNAFRSTARKQLDALHMRTAGRAKKFLPWFIDHLEDTNEALADCQLNNLQDYPQVAGIRGEISEPEKTRFTLRFLDAALTRSLKSDRKAGAG